MTGPAMVWMNGAWTAWMGAGWATKGWLAMTLMVVGAVNRAGPSGMVTV